MLRQAYNADHFVHMPLRECDRELERLLAVLDKQVDATQTSPPPRTKSPQSTRKNTHEFTGDARTMLYECFGTDMTEMTGIDTSNGLVLFTELGADLNAWDTETQFTSWLGLSPNPHASGGKMISSHTRKVSNPVTWAFRMAAKSAAKRKTYLGAFYRRMKARLGAPKAMTATAHTCAIIFYRMVKEKTPYHDLGEDSYQQQNRECAVKRLKQQAKR